MGELMANIDSELDVLQQEIFAAKKRLLEARQRRPKEPVQDYVLKGVGDVDVRLSELFGDKDDLILIHNMGARCPYCTLWADGFIGLLPHFQNRAAFVVCSPDSPENQERFAESRGWKFRMVSSPDGKFIKDMGFYEDSGEFPGYWPGFSTFHREPDGSITRIAKSHFGPGDDFCAVWPMFDMLDGGAKDWEPEFHY